MSNSSTQTVNGEQLWPAENYYQQIKQLQQAIGTPIFIAELKEGAGNGGVAFSAEPLILLQVIDYPQPDPYRRLCPHMLILDDGRGINLGRVIRISCNTAFGPAPQDILFQNTGFFSEVLLAPRVLSRESISATSKEILSRIFGDEPGRLLRGEQTEKLSVSSSPTVQD